MAKTLRDAHAKGIVKLAPGNEVLPPAPNSVWSPEFVASAIKELQEHRAAVAWMKANPGRLPTAQIIRDEILRSRLQSASPEVQAAPAVPRAVEMEAAIPGVFKALDLAEEADLEREHNRRRSWWEPSLDPWHGLTLQQVRDHVYPYWWFGRSPGEPTPEETLIAYLERHPRAALYLRAKNQFDNTRRFDNSGKCEAGRRAMSILLDGGSIEDATAALAVRLPVSSTLFPLRTLQKAFLDWRKRRREAP